MGDPDGEAVKTAKNVPGSEGIPCRWDATGRNGIASPPEGNAYGSRRYISGEATEQGTRNRQQRNRKQVSETGTGTETETETETEKRQGIGKRLPRNPKPERRKTSGKQTGNSRNRNPAHRRAQWISGKKFAGTKKAVIFATRNPEGSPGRKCPGLTHDNPVGLHKANHEVKVGNDGV